jgi:hypothetical protein
MADNRYLKTKFWYDPYIKYSLPATHEKLIYIFLLQNPETTQCGVYEVTFKDIAKATGSSLPDVEATMAKLEKDGKIHYDHETGEVFIVNFMRRNPATSPSVRARVFIDLKLIKSTTLLKLWHDQAKAIGFDAEETPLAAPNPNVKTLVDHYNEAYKKVMGVAPPFSKADFRVTKDALREHKNDVERLKSVIEFGVEHIKSKKLTVTMKGCLGDWCFKSYHQRWAECAWQYTGLESPPCDKPWWRE